MAVPLPEISTQVPTKSIVASALIEGSIKNTLHLLLPSDTIAFPHRLTPRAAHLKARRSAPCYHQNVLQMLPHADTMTQARDELVQNIFYSPLFRKLLTLVPSLKNALFRGSLGTFGT